MKPIVGICVSFITLVLMASVHGSLSVKNDNLHRNFPQKCYFGKYCVVEESFKMVLNVFIY